MGIVIRTARPSDLGSLVRLHGLFMEHHARCDARFSPHPDFLEAWKDKITKALEDPDVLVLVAVTGERIVGCAFLLIRPGADDYGEARVGYLCDVYVERDARRNGVTRGFLQEALAWLRSRNIRTLQLSWGVNCPEAAATWPALGFEPLSVTAVLDVGPANEES